MKKQEFSFFSKIISAIKLDRYQELAGEKFTVAIKFIAKLMLLFALVISIGVTFKFNSMLNAGTLIEYLNNMENYGLQSNITEQMVEEISTMNRAYVCIAFYAVTVLYTYIVYFILALMDVLLLSVLGFIVSRIFRIRLKYEAIYNIATYSLTLSILLNMLYILANLTLGYTIEHFSIVYNIISYIYLIAAILIIKSDIIKTNIELMAVVEEQERVKKELEEKKKEEQNKKEKNDNKEKKEENKEHKEEDTDNNPVPEG